MGGDMGNYKEISWWAATSAWFTLTRQPYL
jgi:hypothetical protein